MSTALARLRWSDLVRQEAGRWVGDLECDWLLWEHTGYPVFWQKDPQAECRAQLRAFFDAAEAREAVIPGGGAQVFLAALLTVGEDGTPVYGSDHVPQLPLGAP